VRTKRGGSAARTIGRVRPRLGTTQIRGARGAPTCNRSNRTSHHPPPGHRGLPAIWTLNLEFEASEFAAYDHESPASPAGIRELTASLVSGGGYFAVRLTPDGPFIGFVALAPVEASHGRTRALGYRFRPPYARMGFATEACHAVLADAFARPEVDDLTATTARANVPSRRRLERLGFHLSGETTAAVRMGPDGTPLEFVACHYTLARSDFDGQPPAAAAD